MGFRPLGPEHSFPAAFILFKQPYCLKWQAWPVLLLRASQLSLSMGGSGQTNGASDLWTRQNTLAPQ